MPKQIDVSKVPDPQVTMDGKPVAVMPGSARLEIDREVAPAAADDPRAIAADIVSAFAVHNFNLGNGSLEAAPCDELRAAIAQAIARERAKPT